MREQKKYTLQVSFSNTSDLRDAITALELAPPLGDGYAVLDGYHLRDFALGLAAACTWKEDAKEGEIDRPRIMPGINILHDEHEYALWHEVARNLLHAAVHIGLYLDKAEREMALEEEAGHE